MMRFSPVRTILIPALPFVFLAACASAPTPAAPTAAPALTPAPISTPSPAPTPTPALPTILMPDHPPGAKSQWSEAEIGEIQRQTLAFWDHLTATNGNPPADVAQIQPVVTERDGQWLVVGLRLSGQDAAQVYGEGAVLTIGIDPETKEKGMLTLSLDGARLALEKQAGLNDAQMAELGLVGPEFMDGRWLVFDKEGLPRVVVNEKNQWQALTVLETASTPLAYFLNADMLYLWSRDKQQFDALTFPKEITEVQAKGQALKVTLADGTEKTLAQDKETGEWKELAIYREFSQLNPETEKDWQTIVEQVQEGMGGGMFMDETEIKQLMDAGWLFVEDAGEHSIHGVVALPPAMVERLNQEFGGEFGASDWAQIINTLSQKDTNAGGLKLSASAVAVAGMDGDKPVVYVLFPRRNPIDTTRVVATVLTEHGREDVEKPFQTPYRKMIARWDSELGKMVLANEFEVRTHWWDQKKRKWVEFERHEAYGDAWESTAHMIEYLVFEDQIDTGSGWFTNVAEIDEAEAKWAIEQLQNHADVENINDQLKTFKIVTNNLGEPKLIILVGGKYGLTPENLEKALHAFNRLNEADPQVKDEQGNIIKPGAIELVAVDNGLKMVAGDIPPKTFKTREEDGEYDFRVASNVGGKIAEVNQPRIDNYIDFISVALTESKEIDWNRHIVYQNGKWVAVSSSSARIPYPNNIGLTAVDFVQQWLNAHKDKLTAKEVDWIQNLIDDNIKHYSQS